MTQMSPIRGGQPVAAGLTADKWAVLNALTEAAGHFGLNHRTLTVLRALLSFYPGRDLPGDPGAAVVYPSNRTLSCRLNGMPESTLRRHLAALVRSGLVTRQDSANRKRFARFGGVAFGFDLSPLTRGSSQILEAAAQARAVAAQTEALRAQLAAMRQRLILECLLAADDPLLEECRRALRRTGNVQELDALRGALSRYIDPDPVAVATPEMSGTDSENGRHIQNTDESESVQRNGQGETDIPLNEVLGSCHEFRSYFPERCTDWNTLLGISDRLYPMMGITRDVYDTARMALGKKAAAVSVICMLETLAEIRCPGAYLRGLATRADRNSFNLSAMLRRVRAVKLSADNPGYGSVAA